MSLLGERDLTVRTFAPGARVDGVYEDGIRAVWTLTVDTATDGEVYGLDLVEPDSVSVSVTADGTATVADLADAIAEAWNDSDAAEYAAAVSDEADTVTITALEPAEVEIVLDENAAKMTLSEVTAGVAPYEDTAIRGTWRPASEEMLQRLADGERARDPRVVYTRTEIQLASQHDGVRSAHVSPDEGATWYEIEADFDGFTALVGPVQHYRYRALRLQEVDG